KAVNIDEAMIGDEGPFTWNQKLTLGLMAALLVSVSVLGNAKLKGAFGLSFDFDVSMAAIIAASIMTLFRAADEEAAVKSMPWNVIVMVCGVTVLISILEKKGGMDLFTTLLARFSTQTSVTGVMGFVTGLISV